MNDLLFIDNLHLLTNRFFVDGFEDHFHKLCTHAALFALSTAFFKNLVITSGLKHCDIVFLFVSTDFACYAHTFCQFLYDVVITFVNLLAQYVQILRCLRFFTDDKQVEDIVQYVRSHLL
jgi:hypothetical protein